MPNGPSSPLREAHRQRTRGDSAPTCRREARLLPAPLRSLLPPERPRSPRREAKEHTRRRLRCRNQRQAAQTIPSRPALPAEPALPPNWEKSTQRPPTPSRSWHQAPFPKAPTTGLRPSHTTLRQPYQTRRRERSAACFPTRPSASRHQAGSPENPASEPPLGTSTHTMPPLVLRYGLSALHGSGSAKSSACSLASSEHWQVGILAAMEAIKVVN